MIERKLILEKLSTQFHAIKRHILATHSFENEKFHITPAQWHILFLIKNNDGLMLKKLALLLDISSSAANQLIDGLLGNGMIEREADISDRRAYKIHLSLSARKFVSEMRCRCLEKLNSVFEPLNDQEIEIYLSLNNKIVDHLLKQDHELKQK